MNYYHAMSAMERGAVLVLTHGPTGDKYTIEPGGEELLPVTYEAILRTPDVEPMMDGLIPGERPQSWRVKTK